MTREDYRIGVPDATSYDEVFNTDDVKYGGSGVVNRGAIRVKNQPDHDMKQSITLTVPPLAAVFLKGRPRRTEKASGRNHGQKGREAPAGKPVVKKERGNPKSRGLEPSTKGVTTCSRRNGLPCCSPAGRAAGCTH